MTQPQNIFTKFNFSKKYKKELLNFVKNMSNVEIGGNRIYDGHGNHYLQNPKEITELIFFLKKYNKKKKFKRFLEIGFAAGVNTNFLNKFFNFEDIIAVDILSGGVDHATFYANLRFKNMTLICGNTNNKKVQNKISLNGPYDIIFIDGGHDYETVKNDFKNFSKLVTAKGVIIFHDVKYCDIPKNQKGVPDFWNEIKKTKKYLIKEFYDPTPVIKTGIGVLIKN